MGRFARTLTISVADTVTAATLHSLIESATLTGLTTADLDLAGVAFPTVTTASFAGATTSPFWFSPDEEDTVFRVWNPGPSIWTAFGPDRFEIPLYNASATLCVRGTQVVASGASAFSIATGASINVLGFLQNDTPSGSYGPVATMGFGWALFSTSTSIAGGGFPAETYAIVNRGCPAGCVAGYSIDTSSGSGPMFGLWLEPARTGYSATFTPRRVMIWRPTLES